MKRFCRFEWRWLLKQRGVTTALSSQETSFESPTSPDYAVRFVSEETNRFKAVTWNILAPSNSVHLEVGNCPYEVLRWETRRESIKNEIDRLDADLLSLQEVERDVFVDHLEPWLKDKGYDAVHYSMEPNVVGGPEIGNVLLHKTEVFSRISSLSSAFRDYLDPVGKGMFFRQIRKLREGFVMALMEHKPSGKEILAIGLQLSRSPKWPDARVAQIHILCETIRSFFQRQARLKDTPVVLLGDFSSFWKKWTIDRYDKIINGRSLTSGVYSLLTEGLLDSDHVHHPSIRDHGGSVKEFQMKNIQFTTSSLVFESAYMRAHGTEPLITKCTRRQKELSDFIFYTPKAIDTLSTLRLPYESHPSMSPQHVKFLNLPNAHYPSNHLPIGAVLVLK